MLKPPSLPTKVWRYLHPLGQDVFCEQPLIKNCVKHFFFDLCSRSIEAFIFLKRSATGSGDFISTSFQSTGFEKSVKVEIFSSTAQEFKWNINHRRRICLSKKGFYGIIKEKLRLQLGLKMCTLNTMVQMKSYFWKWRDNWIEVLV